jgi:hypothetical protein
MSKFNQIIENEMNHKCYKVDIDYEQYLYLNDYDDSNPLYLKMIREYEYIYFLINDDVETSIKNYKLYDTSYLDYLKKFGFIIPKFLPDSKDYNCWWSFRHDKELEILLNSKLTSAQLSLDNTNYGFDKGKIVNSIDQIRQHFIKFPEIDKWIIKDPNGFSGHGQKHFYKKKSIDTNEYYFDENQILKYIPLNNKVLLEPVLDRIFDIGTTFEINDGIITRQFMVENYISSSGGFAGGRASSNMNLFKSCINEKYNYSLDELEVITREIVEKYISMGAISNIQIDSFVYYETIHNNDCSNIDRSRNMKLYPLVEVNYRKTMGKVIQSLADKFNDPEITSVEWKILPHKSKLIKDLIMNDWICLSPEGNNCSSFMKLNKKI